MRIATWNVNSVKARRERLLAFLARHRPDVVCLQELKTEEPGFPREEVLAAGYHAAVLGQKTYNGVAVLTREEPAAVSTGFGDGGDETQARFVAVDVAGLRVASAYVPNGQTVGSEKWAYKLEWLARLRGWAERQAGAPLVLCGDFNVAPEDRDAANPAAWEGTVLCHEQVRAAFGRLLDLGLADAVRLHHPEGGLFTWWDYRQLAFPKNDGLRIDHVLLSEALVPRCAAARVDRDERKGKLPSDHAPVLVELS
ncbi:exodeoxyribonuclease III [Acidobacteria bacterium ACD]|nr:MAG: exodeoxyribonuclease III [Acidobacteriota bacterium]MCE7957720.1 exodeoxyribonuclease III [Acidobacteria bacterium ACB2]MDL1951904.1 exodeoxyribonuclease III [Acidobacteria bacterium ACD]